MNGFDTTPLTPEQQRWHDEWYVPVLRSKRWATCCSDCPLMFEGYGLKPRCCRLPEPQPQKPSRLSQLKEKVFR